MLYLSKKVTIVRITYFEVTSSSFLLIVPCIFRIQISLSLFHFSFFLCGWFQIRLYILFVSSNISSVVTMKSGLLSVSFFLWSLSLINIRASLSLGVTSNFTLSWCPKSSTRTLICFFFSSVFTLQFFTS